MKTSRKKFWVEQAASNGKIRKMKPLRKKFWVEQAIARLRNKKVFGRRKETIHGKICILEMNPLLWFLGLQVAVLLVDIHFLKHGSQHALGSCF
jgi:hypothetical protein